MKMKKDNFYALICILLFGGIAFFILYVNVNNEFLLNDPLNIVKFIDKFIDYFAPMY